MSDNGENETLDFGSERLFEDFSRNIASDLQTESTKDGTNETLDQMKTTIDELKQENEELRRHMRLLVHPENIQEGSPNLNHPVAQVLFFNHDAVCFHRQQIEDFFEYLTTLTKDDTRGVWVSDSARPLPQISARPLWKDLGGTSSHETFMITGNVQYYQRFCIDRLGRPLVDGDIRLTTGWDIPCYSAIFQEALPIDETDKPTRNKRKRNKATCWNCGNEDHSLRDCPYPRDIVKISMAKKEFMEQNVENASLNQRYHKEGEEDKNRQFAKFRPGRISNELREALGLDRSQVPPYIYQMRLLGYPPGYLKQAEVLRSGLTVYDIKDGDEPGQMSCDEMDSRPSYDPSKLIEYPGFNVGLPEGVIEPHGAPPMQPAHSKDAFELFMTPPRGSDESRKRGQRDFAENPNTKRPCLGREELDMELDDNTRDVVSGNTDFKPPLPPTPTPEIRPPLPTSTPPATPGSTSRTTRPDSPNEFPAIESPGGKSADADIDTTSQSTTTPRSMSPSMDDLELMQSHLREALMQAATDGSSVASDPDTVSDRFIVDGEEFLVESASCDEEGNELSGPEGGCEPTLSENENGQTSTEGACEPWTSDADKELGNKESGELAEKGSISSPTGMRTDNPEQTALEDSSEPRDGDLEPGELVDTDLEATPNRSGVPHISKFAVGISPHTNDNIAESSGVLKRILGIFKRNKGKPTS